MPERCSVIKSRLLNLFVNIVSRFGCRRDSGLSRRRVGNQVRNRIRLPANGGRTEAKNLKFAILLAERMYISCPIAGQLATRTRYEGT
jgi:hypothetical protein